MCYSSTRKIISEGIVSLHSKVKKDKIKAKWEILEEEDVSPSKWYPIKKHKVKLPNGNIIDDYFVSNFGNISLILPILANGDMVFVKQYKHGLGRFMIELPAGMQQDQKTIEESAIAELEEETGISTTVENLTPLGKICQNPTKSFVITHGFLATDLLFNSEQKLDETEEIEIIVISPSVVLEMIISGEIWVADTVSMILKALLSYPEIFA
mgnify:CR=1 FL=1